MRLPNKTHIVILALSLFSVTPSFCRSKCLSGNCFNGTGKATLAGVKTYEGSFLNGKPEGIGTLKYSNGHTINGSFSSWQPVGDNTLTCANGSEHTIDPANDLYTQIKSACLETKPIEIDYKAEAEIQRKLDRVAIYSRNMRIADQVNSQRKAFHAQKVAQQRNSGASSSANNKTYGVDSPGHETNFDGGWKSAIAENQMRAKTYISRLMSGEDPRNLKMPNLIEAKGWKSKIAYKKVVNSMQHAQRMALAGKYQSVQQPQYDYNGESSANQSSTPTTPATINGEWDSKGNHYTPAGGDNAWRSDGTFMQKAAGGYIDTKTGQFVPAN
jgi:hypothetical protein